MKIKCLHGYFIFDDVKSSEISRFMSMTGLSLVLKNNYYTFEDLENAKDYSILGAPYLNAIATKTFEGKPWEVMRANNLVYNFNMGTLVPILSVTQLIQIQTAANYYLSDGLILPGSLTKDGRRVKEYAAWYLFESGTYRYQEVSYE